MSIIEEWNGACLTNSEEHAMRIATLTLTVTAMALTSGSLFAQSYTLDKNPPPMNVNDAFVLTLTHPVVVGKHVLEPGRYQFEPLDVAGGDLPVLTIRKEDGGKIVAAMIASAFKEFGPPASYATYYQIDHKYYFNRIFVQGLNYGFKFELPKEARKNAAR